MTKKMALVVLLVILVALPASAARRSPVTFSLKGGIDYATLETNATSDSPDNLLGFGGGISFGTAMTPNVAFDLDLLYVGKGASQEYRDGNSLENSTITFETKLDYVVVSPLLRVSPGRSGAGIYFVGGPEFGYLVNATSVSSKNGSEDFSTDLSDEFKEIDISINFGFGFQSGPASGPGFFLESRYAYGLADIADSAGQSATSPEVKVNTRGLYLFGGMRF